MTLVSSHSCPRRQAILVFRNKREMCLNLETVMRLRPKTPVRNNGGYLIPLPMATAPPTFSTGQTTADTQCPCYLEGRSHVYLSFFSPPVQWLDLVPGQRLPVPPHHSAALLCPWKVGLRGPVCAPYAPAWVLGLGTLRDGAPLPCMGPWAWNSQRGSSFVESSLFKFRKLTFPEMEAPPFSRPPSASSFSHA